MMFSRSDSGVGEGLTYCDPLAMHLVFEHPRGSPLSYHVTADQSDKTVMIAIFMMKQELELLVITLLIGRNGTSSINDDLIHTYLTPRFMILQMLS